MVNLSKNFTLYSFLFLLLFSGCIAKKEKNKGSGQKYQSSNKISDYSRLMWSHEKLIQSPINIAISNDFSFDEQLLIKSMGTIWDDTVTTYNFFSFPEIPVDNMSPASIDSYYDSEMGIYKSYEWYSNVNENALAVTQYFTKIRNNGTTAEYYELFHADIIINYKYFDFTTDKTSSLNYDLPSVILHEFGHLLGLPHETDYYTASVMQPYMSTFLPERDLYPADKDKIISKYGSQTTRSFVNNRIQNNDKKDDDIIVRGVIELRSDGHCYHYLENELIKID